MRKKMLVRFLAVLCFLATLMSLASSASGTTVLIESGNAEEDGTVIVPLMIEGVTNLGFGTVNLTFDTSVVNVTAVTSSSFDLEPNLFTRGPGWVKLQAGQIGTGLDGDVKLCDVTLHAIGNAGDTSPLNLKDVVLNDIATQRITVDSITNGTFTIAMNNPPMPNITNPQDGATLSGLVTIEEIDESGEEDIIYNLFEYYYDENCNFKADDGNDWHKIENDTDGSNGWRVNWYTTQYPDCCYMIRATMGDELGQTGQDEINVALSNHDPVPVITSPQDGDTLSGVVTIEEIDASFEEGEDIVYNLFEYYYDKNCDFKADDGNDWYEIGNDTDGRDGWSVNWDTTQYPDCCYMIRATMGDKHGRTGTTGINVALSNHDPIPVITSPPNGATLSGLVTIKGVDKSGEKDIVYNLFEYYYDKNCNREADDGNDWYEIGKDTDGSNGWSVDWDTTQYQDCCYMVRATMGDRHGGTGQDEINVMLSNHDPIPVITNPQDGDTLSGVVTIEEIDTSFEEGEDIVYNLFEYYYDENCNCEADDRNDWYVIGNDTDGSDGWSVNWDTTQYQDCCYMIKATMGDKHGRTGTTGINVALSNHDPIPVITSPQDGATLSGLVTIKEVDISGEEDTVYNLFEYYYDENCNCEADDGNDWYEIGKDTDGSDGWSVDWDTTQYPDCCYMVRATMGDRHGGTGQDEINVVLSNHDPIPVITNPQDGDTLSGVVTIEEIDASFDDGEDIVYNLFEYYYDENCNREADDRNDWYEIGNDTDGSDGWSADWNTTQYPDGCYMIRATMGDKHGRTGTTAINVKIDNIPLVVTRTPIVTNATATPAIIPDDTDNDPGWGEIATLNVSVISQSSVSVMINLSAIGGSAVQPMTNIEGDIWSVTTNASDSGWNGTAYEPYLLQVNATNMEGKTNTSVSIELTVMKNGDVMPYDGDGVVDFMHDALYLVRHTQNVPGYEALRKNIADVTGDGEVDFMHDALYLVRHTQNVPGYEVLH